RVVVSSGYFETVHARLISGRLFDDHDTAAAPGVAIVDQTLATRFWPGDNPIGRRLYHPEDPNSLVALTPTTTMFTVVGVIAPLKLETLLEAPHAGAYYFPIAQQPERAVTFAVRTETDAATLSHTVRDAIQAVDPE